MLNEAFELWLPTLQDIIVRQDDVDLGSYYKKFGFEQLVVPDDCPHVADRMDTLKTLFDNRYGFRMINKETLEQWQIALQNNFDRVVRIYERAYVLYEKYEQEMLDDMIGGERITRDTTGDSSLVNTPDYTTNETDDYADSRNRSKVKETISTIRTGDGLIESVNDGFRRWIDIDQSLISEFENNFLNIFWY